METWHLFAGLVAVVIAATALLYRVWRRTQDDIAWAIKDLTGVRESMAEVRKDVEWLVWHFKRAKEEGDG